MANNIQTKINKLLMALRLKGIVYKVNTSQYYSEKRERICTNEDFVDPLPPYSL